MRRLVLMLAFVTCMTIAFANVSAYAATGTKSNVTIKVKDSNKELLSYNGSITTSNGKAKFTTSSGSVLKSTFFVNRGSVYYANKKGYLADGWEKISGNYYFFDRDDHRMKRDCKQEKVTITRYGVADSSSKSRAKCYAKIDNIVDSKTKRTDSKSAKLKKCFKYILSLNYHRYREYRNLRSKKNWDVTFANDIVNHKQGCCVSESAAFAFMAVACGYTRVTVCCDTGHAWVDIAGKLYDPLFAESRNFNANYNARYTDYRSNPAIKQRLN